MVKSAYAAFAALVLVSTALPAQAEVLASGVYRSVQTNTIPTSLKITNAGATTLPFNMPAAGTIQIAFSSECAVARAGNLLTDGASIDILIDGVSHPATITNDDYWCTANATAAMDGWQHPAIVVAGRVAAGAHTVRVTIVPNGPAGVVWFIDDTSLVVSH